MKWLKIDCIICTVHLIFGRIQKQSLTLSKNECVNEFMIILIISYFPDPRHFSNINHRDGFSLGHRNLAKSAAVRVGYGHNTSRNSVIPVFAIPIPAIPVPAIGYFARNRFAQKIGKWCLLLLPGKHKF